MSSDDVTPTRKALDPYSDGSGGFLPPELGYGMNFRDVGSYGLRQYSGWIREEFLPQLMGRQAVTVYREMLDNSSTIGAMLFAIQQSMRHVEWRVESVTSKNSDGDEWTEFANSLRLDMSHTWEDFIAEALSMLGYGFSVHEIVYKRRLGPDPMRTAKLTRSESFGPNFEELPSSQFEDGRIGWRRLPIRGQDTILKWFFDQNGQVRGATQQPWLGTLIDIPIEKMLLFRPSAHKNNPEGRSVLRSAYRSYYFVKRLEEMEAILFERMAGFPVMYVPSQLMETATNGTGTDQVQAAQALRMYKNIVTNCRIDEQMGAVLPSDTYVDADGRRSSVKMYEFELLTPQHGRSGVDVDKTITRHKIDMLMTTLCDFIYMGHEVRGTNNLGTVKVDMFYSAIEGWLDGITQVLNRYALPRIWAMNGLDRATMPQFRPDMPQRLDLDGLGNFIKNVAASGMALFPDEELEGYLRDAAGLPEVNDPANSKAISLQAMDQESMKKMLFRAVARQIKKNRAE